MKSNNRKPHLAPANLAARLDTLERELAAKRAQLQSMARALFKEQMRNRDLAARVPVDVAHARRTLNRSSGRET